MVRLTKGQLKRMVRDISAKTKKLYLNTGHSQVGGVVSTPDMAAIEKLTTKWLKRLG